MEQLRAFAEKIAAFKKFGEPDPDNDGEPFEPSDGVDDSHNCLMDLIDEARELIAQTPDLPTIVVEMNGGAIYNVRGSQAARVILLDEDVEGSDGERVMEVMGQECYVHDYQLTDEDGIDPGFIRLVAGDIDGMPIDLPTVQDEVPVGTAGTLVTLDGEKISGTSEIVLGTADISLVTRKPDGSLDIEFGGETDIDWNTQKSVRDKGELQFVTVSGGIVPASQVKLVAA